MPDGYNIGLNAREADGHTVAHAHAHMIHRYRTGVQGSVRPRIVPKRPNDLSFHVTWQSCDSKVRIPRVVAKSFPEHTEGGGQARDSRCGFR